jgi:hypothetical protein
MKRYFLLKDSKTLEVYVSPLMKDVPENSMLFEPHNFKKACFNQFPNPTMLVEGITQEELNEIEKASIPQIITRRQFKIALAILDKNEQSILNGIEQLPEPQRTIARISYIEAGTFERNNPELITVATAFLQMNEQQIDQVFIIGNQY